MYTQLVCALKFPEITLNISSGGNEALGRQTASRLFAESFVLVTIRVHCGDLGGQTASKFQIILLRLERNQMSLGTIGVPLLRVGIESKSDQISSSRRAALRFDGELGGIFKKRRRRGQRSGTDGT